jgi:hypothetical protein
VGTVSATTISARLAYQLFQIALEAGERPSMAKLKAGGRRKRDSYTIHITNGQESTVVDGELFYRVHARYRDQKIVDVVGLDVSGEHTYVVNGVGVHTSVGDHGE